MAASRPAWTLAGRAALAALFMVFLASCAQLERAAPEAPVFELHARLAAKYREESFTGALGWRHGERSDEMLITSPIGAGVARIVREGDSVTLTTAEPREYRATDAEALTEQVLGFRLPLAGLADWVRGQAAESPRPVERFEDGRLKTLEQGGWKIEYQTYEGERPARMRLLYPGIELRLAITEWK
jgi:outer membrane lipoprotein LolB